MSENYADVPTSLLVLRRFFVAFRHEISLVAIWGVFDCVCPSVSLSTVSLKRRRGVLRFWLDFDGRNRPVADLVCGYGKLVSSFSRVICRVGSVPAVFCFMGLSTSVTFWFCRFSCVGDAILCFDLIVSVFS